MKFNKNKFQILHLGWGNPGCMYGLEDESLESSPSQSDLGILVDGNFYMNQQCVLAAKKANLS